MHYKGASYSAKNPNESKIVSQAFSMLNRLTCSPPALLDRWTNPRQWTISSSAAWKRDSAGGWSFLRCNCIAVCHRLRLPSLFGGCPCGARSNLRNFEERNGRVFDDLARRWPVVFQAIAAEARAWGSVGRQSLLC
uniref:Uncharacterized protein n=1 Tax=Leersia perrieri TaxID=77586 RepID=A0A0D9XQI2_9ORYZ